MKKLLFFLIAAVLSIQLVYAQSLADIAKQEKERRAKLKQQGITSRVVTNEDIESVKEKRLGIEPSSEETTTEAEQASAETAPNPEAKPEEKQATAPETPESEETNYEKSKSIEQIDKQIAQLKEKLQDLKKKRDEEQDRINRGAGIFTFNPGEAYQKIREYDQQIKDIELQIQTLEAQKLGT